MANKHIVTDKNGKIHKRISANRIYAFAVIHHWDAYQFDNITIDAGSSATWCSRADLADKEAARCRQYHCVNDVEIIPVTPSN